MPCPITDQINFLCWARFQCPVQRRMKRTVWNTGGCQSWYLDANGRNTTLWPTFTFEFMRRLRHADLADYEAEPLSTERREMIPA